MSPELIQWLIYGGLVVGGYLLRHYGISLPLLPAPTQPALPAIPSLPNHPILNQLLKVLGPEAEQKVLAALLQVLQPQPAPKQ